MSSGHLKIDRRRGTRLRALCGVAGQACRQGAPAAAAACAGVASVGAARSRVVANLVSMLRVEPGLAADAAAVHVASSANAARRRAKSFVIIVMVISAS